MTSQLGVSNAISTPRRLAISVPTSMSKPWYSPSAVELGLRRVLRVGGHLDRARLQDLVEQAAGDRRGAASLGATLGASLDRGLAGRGRLTCFGRARTASATAGARPDRDRGHGQQDDRKAAAPPGNCVHVSSMTHRSRCESHLPPQDARSNAAQCRRNPRDARGSADHRSTIGWPSSPGSFGRRVLATTGNRHRNRSVVSRPRRAHPATFRRIGLREAAFAAQEDPGTSHVASIGSGAPTGGKPAAAPGARSHATRNPNVPAPAASHALPVTKPMRSAGRPVAFVPSSYTAGCGLNRRAASTDRA